MTELKHELSGTGGFVWVVTLYLQKGDLLRIEKYINKKSRFGIEWCLCTAAMDS